MSMQQVGERRPWPRPRSRPGRAGRAAAAASARGRGPRTGRTGTRCSRAVAAASTRRRGEPPTARARCRRTRPRTTPPRHAVDAEDHAPRTSQEDQFGRVRRYRKRRGCLRSATSRTAGHGEEHAGEDRRHDAGSGLPVPRLAERDVEGGHQQRAGRDRLRDQVGRHHRSPRRRVGGGVGGAGDHPGGRRPQARTGWPAVVSAQIIPSAAIAVRSGSSAAWSAPL